MICKTQHMLCDLCENHVHSLDLIHPVGVSVIHESKDYESIEHGNLRVKTM